MGRELSMTDIAARLEIQNVLADYALGIDQRDPARWLSAFHNDAVFEVGFPLAVLRGHDEILAWAEDVWRFQTISHITSSHHIVVTGDHGEGTGRGVGLFKLEDGQVMLASARLEDVYLKRDAEWRILKRKVEIISSFILKDAIGVMLNGIDASSLELLGQLPVGVASIPVEQLGSSELGG